MESEFYTWLFPNFFVNWRTIKKNIKLILSDREGGFLNLFYVKDFGSGDYYQGFHLVQMDFLYNSRTGEILSFGELKDIKKKVKDEFEWGLFKVVLLPRERKKDIKFFLKDYILPGKVSSKVRTIFKGVIKDYNKTYGFNPGLEKP